MTDAIRHRGPDDSGAWIDDMEEVALGHRRLSVIDLSQHGHQPMISSSGRYVIVFNGEIYNFAKLRDELAASGLQFKGHSDTEVLLGLIEHNGIEAALRLCVGMFALAVWDRSARALHLARDRAGEKPLYFGRVGSAVVFASELHAIRQFPGFSGRIDRRAVVLFTRFNYVPAPHCIYEDMYKVLPGEIVTVRRSGERWDTVHTSYWDAAQNQREGRTSGFEGNDAEAVEHLDGLLRQSISEQLISDVPLGAFLSGGIDSSTVVGIMQSLSARPVRTFTIGFPEKLYDESQYAREVARHLGTDHTEMLVTANEALDVIPRLPAIYDEPFADASQVPTYLVSKLARAHVTVALSGDAGDELFGGYNRYSWASGIWSRVGWLPSWGRSALAAAIEAVPPTAYDRAFELVCAAVRRRSPIALPGDKLHKIARVMRARDREEVYRNLVTMWSSADRLTPGGSVPEEFNARMPTIESAGGFEQWMMLLDFITYLRDDILVKVDRASMAVSLESRVPFLDHRIVDFANRLPLHMKVRNGVGKWLLRQVAYRYVPKDLLERPKIGFGIPIDSWLRGPLREWAESLLSVEKLRKHGFFDVDVVHHRWREHISGRRQWHYQLWTLLMFQAWLEQHEGTPAGAG